MKDVKMIRRFHNDFILDTGSPHYIKMVNDVMDLDVFKKGSEIRHSKEFEEEGINVNFVEHNGPGEISVRTYERGVEDETFACGTGVVAAAIASAYASGNNDLSSWTVHAKGGDLRVDFLRSGKQDFTKVHLTGPAVEVFRGEIPGP
jgi:diaminopimelate epimerase